MNDSDGQVLSETLLVDLALSQIDLVRQHVRDGHYFVAIGLLHAAIESIRAAKDTRHEK